MARKAANDDQLTLLLKSSHGTELIVDNFAGGGGASTGIEQAIGRPVDIAINHDPEAVAMHLVNHPRTEHFCESVWSVDPRKVTAGRPVGLAWFSPDCKHFSKAKGGKPVEKRIRGLAWVVMRWIGTVRPRVVVLENVEEFVTWGPLVETANGMVPNPKQKGRTFRSFVNAMRRHGYEVDWRELRACDFGAPTIRKRLFLIARCDGRPILWPDLDNVAAFYGVTRRDGEADAALRARTVDRIKGWSSAGGASHYRYFATSADPRVKDAAVDSPAPGLVRISILSSEGDGTAPADLLAAVRAAVTKDDVRVLTDTVDVVTATIKPVAIKASIWLYPDTPSSVFAGLDAAFRAAFAARAGLGWDLPLSWIMRTLHADGVQRVEVETPAADVAADDTSSVAIGSLDLTLKGRAF